MDQDPEVAISEEFRRADNARRIMETARKRIQLKESLRKTIHRAIAPEWMSIASAMGTQEHYEQLLDWIATSVLDEYKVVDKESEHTDHRKEAH